MHGTLLAMAGSIGIDTLFYASAFNLSGHFQIIQHKIEHLKINNFNDRNASSMDLIDIIKYHKNIIDMCNELTKLYQPILFTQFLISSVQICVIAFQLTLVKKN